MTAKGIARRFGRLDRFRLVGSVGFVSDDTEQSALIAQSLLRHPDDPERCARAFQRSLLGWFCRLPWGIGWGTVRACCRIALGFRPSGVRSAGNGAAMRAAIVGMFFQDHDQAELRLTFGRSLAQVTHRDERAVEGALYVAELAAACGRSRVNDPDRSLAACQKIARAVVTHPELGPAIDRARDLALAGASVPEAASQCGTSGYIVHTVAFATFCFLRQGDEPMTALGDAIAAGGDTDSIAAILGAWLGAYHGDSCWPADLLARMHDGPFGPSHLRALANGLAQRRAGGPGQSPSYSTVGALVRNLVIIPVILGHGFRRLLPF
jgi:ADP-ribosylglycohydrolase